MNVQYAEAYLRSRTREAVDGEVAGQGARGIGVRNGPGNKGSQRRGEDGLSRHFKNSRGRGSERCEASPPRRRTVGCIGPNVGDLLSLLFI